MFVTTRSHCVGQDKYFNREQVGVVQLCLIRNWEKVRYFSTVVDASGCFPTFLSPIFPSQHANSCASRPKLELFSTKHISIP